MNPRSKRKMQALIDALVNNRGLVYPSCREAKVAPKSYYNWYHKYPEFKQKVDEINNINLDFVEEQLYQKIAEGNEKLIIFYLQYRGRNRGYTNSPTQFNISGEGKIKIQFGGENENPDTKEDNDDNPLLLD